MTKTNIKPIPTQLNYYTHINKQNKKIKKQTNISRLLIIGLIIWNIVLSIKVFYQPQPNIPLFDDETLNQQIMVEEGIPNLPPIDDIKVN